MHDLSYSKPLRSTLAALVVATLTACAVGPDYTRPDLPVPERYASDTARLATSVGGSATTGASIATNETTATSGGAAISVTAPLPDADAEFWKSFDDPLLDNLVDTALVANHDLRIALSRFDQANALLREAGFDRLPTVTANAAPATRARAPTSCRASRASSATRTATRRASSPAGSSTCSAASGATPSRSAPMRRPCRGSRRGPGCHRRATWRAAIRAARLQERLRVARSNATTSARRCASCRPGSMPVAAPDSTRRERAHNSRRRYHASPRLPPRSTSRCIGSPC